MDQMSGCHVRVLVYKLLWSTVETRGTTETLGSATTQVMRPALAHSEKGLLIWKRDRRRYKERKREREEDRKREIFKMRGSVKRLSL